MNRDPWWWPMVAPPLPAEPKKDQWSDILLWMPFELRSTEK